MAACRSCGAPIVWAKTAAGKAMPLDAASVLVMVPRAPTGTADEVVVDAVRGHLSHFATCPHAAQHRKDRT